MFVGVDISVYFCNRKIKGQFNIVFYKTVILSRNIVANIPESKHFKVYYSPHKYLRIVTMLATDNINYIQTWYVDLIIRNMVR